MKNTDLFYSLAKEYQDKRRQKMQSFENRSEQLSQMRGNRYFDAEMTKATNEKDAALTSLKREYSEHFGAVLSSMDKANRQRKLTPPTEEELRLISLLKMKDKLTEQELDAAANMLKGNSTCLAVLTKIAHKQGYLRGYMNCSDNAEMSAESVKTAIDSLNSSVRILWNLTLHAQQGQQGNITSGFTAFHKTRPNCQNARCLTRKMNVSESFRDFRTKTLKHSATLLTQNKRTILG